jgi:hypothetical protein
LGDRRNAWQRYQEADCSLAEPSEIAELTFFAGQESTRPAKTIILIFRWSMFLLWGISLPEQKMKPSGSSVGSIKAGERQWQLICFFSSSFQRCFALPLDISPQILYF